ncbi:MAG: rod shape-determining protein MreC [Burkholderiaceae bacterium]|nr:rod shape-determining protein MreC [Burkholderiaceae bacterium]
MRAFESGPPPLFNQGVPARARLAFFSFLAIALVVIDSRIKVLETVRVGLGVVLYPVQQTLLVPGRMADAVGDYFTSVTTLRRENDELRRRQVESAQALLQAQQVGARERIGHGATLGTVLYESRDRFSHKIVLHVGLEDGVRAGNPVIDDIGVVGQVTRVFARTAEVTLLTDKDQSIPIQIVRNGLRGIAFGGAEPGTLDLRFMAANADVVNGDVAVTSGLDGVYPAGLPVGSVRLVERAAKDQFARIVLDPSAGVENHTHLLVLLVEPAARPAPPPAVEAAPRRAGKR